MFLANFSKKQRKNSKVARKSHFPEISQKIVRKLTKFVKNESLPTMKREKKVFNAFPVGKP
jgi:hypothetical protein